MSNFNPLEYNGGACLAMAGKGCFVIASDHRTGAGMATHNMDLPKLIPINSNTVIGLSGLLADQQTFADTLKYRLSIYRLKECRDISGKGLASLIRSVLYQSRLAPIFVEPILGSIDSDGKVYLCSTDLIGALCEPCDYVCAGTCADSLHGICETLWRPDCEPEDLFEIAVQALLSSCDRNILSGYGATVMIVTQDKIQRRVVKGRQD